MRGHYSNSGTSRRPWSSCAYHGFLLGTGSGFTTKDDVDSTSSVSVVIVKASNKVGVPSNTITDLELCFT
ncbi:hypothetical protein L1887_36037 [Cichorium endivia]|nr:hypothetical protein L1887_36037 [Cichorium endivia]